MRGLLFTGGHLFRFCMHNGYLLGVAEPAVQRAVMTHLRPGDVFYDIGASVGFLSLLGAKCVGAEGHVYCFEPQSSVVPILAGNLDQNGFSNYDIIEAAVSDSSGSALIKLEGDQSGKARLVGDRGGPPAAEAPRARSALTVRLVTLDELDLPAPALVKIDVEGAESQVLRGMTRVLREHQPTLIIEIHGDQGPPVEAILGEAGYRIAVFDNEGMRHLLAHAPNSRDDASHLQREGSDQRL
jgi:FkbM family methyltransferase